MKKTQKMAMLFVLWTSLTIVSLTASGCSSESSLTDAYIVEGYQRVTVAGYTVMVEDDLVERPSLYNSVISKLEGDLRYMMSVVPAKAIKATKQTKIWMNFETEVIGGLGGRGACYYQSAGYLVRWNQEIAKVHGIEVFNAKEFLIWKGIVGSVMIHEFAHSYHFKAVTDLPGGDVWAAYANALVKGKYDKVQFRYIDNQLFKAYALANSYEYFAELSEAYFKLNNYYPHTAAELKEFDPMGYELMETMWNK